MQLNPFGPKAETSDRATRILAIISERSLEIVCEFKYITEFDRWREDFNHLISGS
jgi:hydroxyacylglutathione hydrolase